VPTFDVKCETCNAQYETLLRRHTDPNPDCPVCLVPMERLPAAPATIYAKPLGEYGDRSKEYYNPDGIVAYRNKTTRNADGSPEKVFLRTIQEQREYCKAEGLIMPNEINSNAEINRSGRGLSTSGVKGQWSGLPAPLCETGGSKHEIGWV